MNLREEDTFTPVPGADELVVPGPPPEHQGPGPDERVEARSLLEDLETLIGDGRNYLEAEANYQKTRAVYVADRVRAAAFLGAIGAAFGFIALIGLTVGAILTLDQWMPTSLASMLVVGIEGLLALYFLHRASRRWSKIMRALDLDERRVG